MHGASHSVVRLPNILSLSLTCDRNRLGEFKNGAEKKTERQANLSFWLKLNYFASVCFVTPHTHARAHASAKITFYTS